MEKDDEKCWQPDMLNRILFCRGGMLGRMKGTIVFILEDVHKKYVAFLALITVVEQVP